MNIFETNVIFAPTIHYLDKIDQYKAAPCIVIKSDSGKVKRTVAPIANVGKKAVFDLAKVICAIFTGVYSLVSYPIRAYKQHKIEKLGIKQSLALLDENEKGAFRKDLERHLESHPISKPFLLSCIWPFLSSQRKENLITEAKDKITASYFRSKKIYGPVARAWTDALLEKAHKEHKKVVFLARDGIAPYRIAKALMKTQEYREKYPELVEDKQITLAYFSRKVINSAVENDKTRGIFDKYVTKELGLKDGDKCIFVDVGFEGSMIDNFRNILLPRVGIDFEYLISLTPKANGFLATNEKRLTSVAKAGGNPGIHWLEDTHQGSQESPKELVEVAGNVYPNTRVPEAHKYCVRKNSLEYLVREFSQDAVVESAKGAPIPQDQRDTIKKTFDATLGQIKAKEIPLFVEHR